MFIRSMLFVIVDLNLVRRIKASRATRIIINFIVALHPCWSRRPIAIFIAIIVILFVIPIDALVFELDTATYLELVRIEFNDITPFIKCDCLSSSTFWEVKTV
jgi:hypothetical protein